MVQFMLRGRLMAAALIAAMVATATVQVVAQEPAGAPTPLGPAAVPVTVPLTALELAALPLGTYTGEVEQSWRSFLEEQGYREGRNADEIFIASGTAIVTFPKGSPGWIEARRIAFQVAQLRAKVALVRFLGQEITSTRDFSLLENASFGQGYIDEVATLSRAEQIVRKAVDFTELTLDTVLRELDPNYDPAQYQNQEAREIRLEQALNERISVNAARLVSGAITFHVIEGPTDNGQSQIFVGILWSPALGQLATDVADGEYGMPLLAAAAQAEGYLPKTVGGAIASFGTQVIINERGERALLAYGQAEPSNVSPEQRDLAEQAALGRAEVVALAELASFVAESLTSTLSVESQALMRVYDGLAQTGTAIEAQSVEQIRARTVPLTVSGVEVILREIVEHPETGQRVAIVAVLWSPAGVAAAGAIEAAIENPGAPAIAPIPAPPAPPAPAEPPLVLERPAGNANAF